MFYEGGGLGIEAIRLYLFSLIAASFLTSLVLAVIPKGPVRTLAGSFCGLALLLTAFAPIVHLDHERIAAAISRLDQQREEAQTGVSVRNRELVSQIISSRVRSYILDKAVALGCTVTAEIEMQDDGTYPYPYAVTLHGTADSAQRQALQQYLEIELAVPKERQVWTP